MLLLCDSAMDTLLAELVSVITNDGRSIVVRPRVRFLSACADSRNSAVFYLQGVLKGVDDKTNIILSQVRILISAMVFVRVACSIVCFKFRLGQLSTWSTAVAPRAGQFSRGVVTAVVIVLHALTLVP